MPAPPTALPAGIVSAPPPTIFDQQQHPPATADILASVGGTPQAKANKKRKSDWSEGTAGNPWSRFMISLSVRMLVVFNYTPWSAVMKWIQSTLGFKTLDKAAALGLETATPLTDPRQYINSNLGFRNLKIWLLYSKIAAVVVTKPSGHKNKNGNNSEAKKWLNNMYFLKTLLVIKISYSSSTIEWWQISPHSNRHLLQLHLTWTQALISALGCKEQLKGELRPLRPLFYYIKVKFWGF